MSSELFEAVGAGDADATEELIEMHNLNVNTLMDLAGDSPLHAAVRSGSEPVLALLISRFRADTTVRNPDTQETALHVAAQSGALPAAHLLLGVRETDAVLDAQDEYGMTALHYAARLLHAGMVEALLDAGAAPNLVDEDDQTPASLARAAAEGARRKEEAETALALIEEALAFDAPDVAPPTATRGGGGRERDDAGREDGGRADDGGGRESEKKRKRKTRRSKSKYKEGGRRRRRNHRNKMGGEGSGEGTGAGAAAASGLFAFVGSAAGVPMSDRDEALLDSLDELMVREAESSGLEEELAMFARVLASVSPEFRDPEYNPLPVVIDIIKNQDSELYSKLESWDAMFDKIMSVIVSRYDEPLNTSISNFGRVSAAIHGAVNDVAGVEAQLLDIKSLLVLRTRNIRRLYSGILQAQEEVRILARVQAMTQIPDVLDTHIAREEYLPAVQLLNASIAELCSEDLQNIGALNDVMRSLFDKRSEYYALFTDALLDAMFDHHAPTTRQKTESIGRLVEALGELDSLSPALKLLYSSLHSRLKAIIVACTENATHVPNTGQLVQGVFSQRRPLQAVLDAVCTRFESVLHAHASALIAFEEGIIRGWLKRAGADPSSVRILAQAVLENDSCVVKAEFAVQSIPGYSALFSLHDVAAAMQLEIELVVCEYLGLSKSAIKLGSQQPQHPQNVGRSSGSGSSGRGGSSGTAGAPSTLLYTDARQGGVGSWLWRRRRRSLAPNSVMMMMAAAASSSASASAGAGPNQGEGAPDSGEQDALNESGGVLNLGESGGSASTPPPSKVLFRFSESLYQEGGESDRDAWERWQVLLDPSMYNVLAVNVRLRGFMGRIYDLVLSSNGAGAGGGDGPGGDLSERAYVVPLEMVPESLQETSVRGAEVIPVGGLLASTEKLNKMWRVVDREWERRERVGRAGELHGSRIEGGMLDGLIGGQAPAGQSHLVLFLDQVIDRDVMPVIEQDYRARAEAIMDGPDAFTPRMQHGEVRPLLMGTWEIHRLLLELNQIHMALPDNGAELAQVMEVIVLMYWERCKIRVSEIVSDSMTEHLLTVRDLVSHYTRGPGGSNVGGRGSRVESEGSVGAWLDALAVEPQMSQGDAFSGGMQGSSSAGGGSSTFVDDRIRGDPAFLSREAELLREHLLSDPPSRDRLVGDMESLTLLAALSDSTEWLAERMDALGFGVRYRADAYDPPQSILLCPIHGGKRGGKTRGSRLSGLDVPLLQWSVVDGERHPVVTEGWEQRCCERAELARVLGAAATFSHSLGLATNLDALADKFRALSENIMIALRIEVRVYAYHHLRGIREVGYDVDVLATSPDYFIIDLNKTLKDVHGSLSSVLSRSQVGYVFAGLEWVLGDALIQSMAYVSGVNEHGVGKLVRDVLALQQNISALGAVDETRFDRVRAYLDLLKLSVKKVLAVVSDAGLDFTREEFGVVLNLVSGGVASVGAVDILDRLTQQRGA